MISEQYYSNCPAPDIYKYLRLSPWPHLVLDNFLTEECLEIVLPEVRQVNYNFEIDYRGEGRIEYALLQSKTLWKVLYSFPMISLLSQVFQARISFNKNNLIQIRRMNDATPEFPLHNDYIEGQNTIVAFLYLSQNWKISHGGRLLLHGSSEKDDIGGIVEPTMNKLVAFQTKADYWHSVEKVKCWDRINALIVWDIIE